MDGWIKLYRVLIDHEVFNDEKALKVFIWCLCRADRHTGKLLTGRFQGAKWCKMKPSTFRNKINKLKSLRVIDTKQDSFRTEISICKWAKYQTKEDTKRTERGQKEDTIQEVEEEILTNVSSVSENKDLTEILDAFKPLNPNYAVHFRNKTQRESIKRLIKTHTKPVVLKYIQAAAKAQGKPFAPMITSPYELEVKWPNLEKFYDKED